MVFFWLILDSSPAHESESEFGLASPSLSLESGRTILDYSIKRGANTTIELVGS